MTLKNKSNRILQIENVGRIPVRNVVNIKLRCSDGNQTAIAYRHVDHSIFEIKMFLELDVF